MGILLSWFFTDEDLELELERGMREVLEITLLVKFEDLASLTWGFARTL